MLREAPRYHARRHLFDPPSRLQRRTQNRAHRPESIAHRGSFMRTPHSVPLPATLSLDESDIRRSWLPKRKAPPTERRRFVVVSHGGTVPIGNAPVGCFSFQR